MNFEITTVMGRVRTTIEIIIRIDPKNWRREKVGVRIEMIWLEILK